MNPGLSLPSALRLRLPMAWQRSGLTQEIRSSVLLMVLAGRTGARMCQPRESQRSASGRLVPSVPMNQPAARHELFVGQDTSRNRPVVRLVFSGGTCWIDHADLAAGTAAPGAAAAGTAGTADAAVMVMARLAVSRTAATALTRWLGVIRCPPCQVMSPS